jgi:16S rRNA (cytidine1402-2'-O)-methyltransferase
VFDFCKHPCIVVPMPIDENSTYAIGAHSFTAPTQAPGLYLVATPVGNLGDITLRALEALAGCDVIYCEDTRVTLKLLDRYGIRKPLHAYHDHNTAKAGPEILARLKAGEAVTLVSDAGTPLISDPGYRLVESCIAEGLAVTALPGANALLTAVQLSGLPSDAFTYLGFFPEKQAQRRKALESLQASAMTTVFYESPHRICDALVAITDQLGPRAVAVARELTKLHEEVLRGTAAEVHATLSQRPSVKGEIVLLIGPADDQPTDEEDIEEAIDVALVSLSASQAAAHVAKALKLKRDDVYARILKRKNDEPA